MKISFLYSYSSIKFKDTGKWFFVIIAMMQKGKFSNWPKLLGRCRSYKNLKNVNCWNLHQNNFVRKYYFQSFFDHFCYIQCLFICNNNKNKCVSVFLEHPYNTMNGCYICYFTKFEYLRFQYPSVNIYETGE